MKRHGEVRRALSRCLVLTVLASNLISNSNIITAYADQLYKVEENQVTVSSGLLSTDKIRLNFRSDSLKDAALSAIHEGNVFDPDGMLPSDRDGQSAELYEALSEGGYYQIDLDSVFTDVDQETLKDEDVAVYAFIQKDEDSEKPSSSLKPFALYGSDSSFAALRDQLCSDLYNKKASGDAEADEDYALSGNETVTFLFENSSEEKRLFGVYLDKQQVLQSVTVPAMKSVIGGLLTELGKDAVNETVERGKDAESTEESAPSLPESANAQETSEAETKENAAEAKAEETTENAALESKAESTEESSKEAALMKETAAKKDDGESRAEASTEVKASESAEESSKKASGMKESAAKKEDGESKAEASTDTKVSESAEAAMYVPEPVVLKDTEAGSDGSDEVSSENQTDISTTDHVKEDSASFADTEEADSDDQKESVLSETAEDSEAPSEKAESVEEPEREEPAGSLQANAAEESDNQKEGVLSETAEDSEAPSEKAESVEEPEREEPAGSLQTNAAEGSHNQKEGVLTETAEDSETLSEKAESTETSEAVTISAASASAEKTDTREEASAASAAELIKAAREDKESYAAEMTSAVFAQVRLFANARRTFTYSDASLTVRASVLSSSVLPNDAKLKVTPLTSDTEGYDYEAYMNALNEEVGASDSETGKSVYNDSNTLLYDIAFVGTDRNGAEVEYEPSEGTVKVEFEFHDRQLVEGISADSDEDVRVYHLPLTEEVRSNVNTTKEADRLTAEDIRVERVSSAAPDVAGEKLNFTAGKFSAFAVCRASSSALKAYSPLEIKDVLGETWKYGITANKWTQISGDDAETNFAVKEIDVSHLSQTGVTNKSDGSDSAESYVRDVDPENAVLNIKGKPMIIHCPKELWTGKIKSVGANLQFVDTTKEQVDSYVNDAISSVKQKGGELLERNSAAYESALSSVYRENGGFVTLDFKGLQEGTYYIKVDDKLREKFGKESRAVTINKNDNQTIVFNFEGDSDINLFGYYINGNPCNVESSSAKNGDIEHIIFNAPDAKKVNLSGQVSGIFLFPSAEVTASGSVAGGWLTADKVNLGEEWHFQNGKLPDVFKSGSVSLKARKTIDGVPANVSGFEFRLEEKTGNSWKSVRSAENRDESIEFEPIEYENDGTLQETEHLYRISEVSDKGKAILKQKIKDEKGKEQDTKIYYKADSSYHYVKVTVSPTESKNQDGTSVFGVILDTKYYQDEACTKPESGDYPVFNNETIKDKSGTVDFVFRKKIIGRKFADTDNGKWKFTITADPSDAPMPKTTEITLNDLPVNSDTAEFSFGAITYRSKDIGKTYTYTVNETGAGTDQNGITLSGPVKVMVTVRNTDGDQLEIEKQTQDGTLISSEFLGTFTNCYDAEGTAVISVKKILTGRALTDQDSWNFTIERTDGETTRLPKTTVITVNKKNSWKASFDPIEYRLSDLQGGDKRTIHYKIHESAVGNEPGVVNDRDKNVDVTLRDQGDGTLSVHVEETGDESKNAADSVSNQAELVFNNQYHADGSVELHISKKLVGREFKKGDHWTFTLKPDEKNPDAPLPKGASNGSITVSTNAESGFVQDLSFGKIKYTLDDLKGSDSQDFIYQITESGNVPDVKNDPDKTRTVVVTVKDEGKGQLTATPVYYNENKEDSDTFVNTYSMGTLSLSGHKHFAEGSPKNISLAGYTFGLFTDPACTKPVKIDKDSLVSSEGTAVTAKSDKEGAYSFPVLKYEIPEVGKSLQYYVREIVPDSEKDGVIYDETIYSVRVNVENEGGSFTLTPVITNLTTYKTCREDQLDFSNRYQAEGSLSLQGRKVLQNAELHQGEFQFVLKDEQGNTIHTASNDLNGNFTFDPISYTLSDCGTHHYTISEVLPESKDAELDGISYDRTKYLVTAKVSDNGDGTLKVEKTIQKEEAGILRLIHAVKTAIGGNAVQELIFTNTYKTSPVSIRFGGHKKVTGLEQVEKQSEKKSFTFLLKEGKDASGRVIDSQKVTIDPKTGDFEGNLALQASLWVRNAAFLRN